MPQTISVYYSKPVINPPIVETRACGKFLEGKNTTLFNLACGTTT